MRTSVLATPSGSTNIWRIPEEVFLWRLTLSLLSPLVSVSLSSTHPPLPLSPCNPCSPSSSLHISLSCPLAICPLSPLSPLSPYHAPPHLHLSLSAASWFFLSSLSLPRPRPLALSWPWPHARHEVSAPGHLGDSKQVKRRPPKRRARAPRPTTGERTVVSTDSDRSGSLLSACRKEAASSYPERVPALTAQRARLHPAAWLQAVTRKHSWSPPPESGQPEWSG